MQFATWMRRAAIFGFVATLALIFGLTQPATKAAPGLDPAPPPPTRVPNPGSNPSNVPGSKWFAETRHNLIPGAIMTYWETHGGLAQQGFPVTEQITQYSPDPNTGTQRVRTVQYFERAVFEVHPENAGTPFEVLLSLVGRVAHDKAYPNGSPAQAENMPAKLAANAVTFPETGKSLGGLFRSYWEAHGALAQQGFPISNVFQEVQANLPGAPAYYVQYFERARFEYHPENAGTPYEVLLGSLGWLPLCEGIPDSNQFWNLTGFQKLGPEGQCNGR